MASTEKTPWPRPAVGVGAIGATLGPFCSTNAGVTLFERPLRDGLQERERRRRERRRDARHLDPDQAVADADERPVGQAIGDAETGTEVVLLQRPHRLVAGILEQLRLQIEDTPSAR